MEWLDLERNAAILEKTDRKIAEKLRSKASVEALTASGGGGTKSSALKVLFKDFFSSGVGFPLYPKNFCIITQ